MGKLSAGLLCSSVLFLPVTAAAYIGPGAGLSLLGALWALLVAIATALLFVFAWPVRRMLRRRREARKQAQAAAAMSQSGDNAALAASKVTTLRADVRRPRRQ